MRQLLISTAFLIAISAPALAESGKGVGSWVDQPHDVMTLPDGNSYNMSRSKQIWFSEDVSKLNNVAQDCFTSWIAVTESEQFFGRGWCTGIDADGDVMWSDFDMTGEGGTWRIFGGTGKFENERGGGTWAFEAFYPDGLRGTWSFTYDSEWKGM